MKMALVFVPTILGDNWSTIKAQQENMGIIPPLTLCYVAAVAEKAGHKVVIIDAAAESLSLEESVERIKRFSPDLIGFTITTYGLKQALRWINEIKNRTGLPIIVGGWHLSLYPHETLSHKAIDYAVIGEGEETIPEVLNALENGRELKDIKGFAFRDNGRVVVTASREPVKDIDLIPFPARHLLKKEKYYNILSKGRNFTALLSGRGCPFKCLFCDLNTSNFRLRSAKNFVDEIEECYKNLKITEFDIYDSTFTVNKNRAIEICSEIKKRNLQISWTARTRVDCVDEHIIKNMADAGCSTIMYGIESANKKILQNLKKDIDIERIHKVVRWTKDYGINTLGFFMIGNPGDTIKTIKQTIEFPIELDLDYVQFTKTTPFANSELYRLYMKEYGDDYWREFTLNPDIKKEFPMVGTEITSKEALIWVRRAYMRFFFRLGYIWKSFRKLRSWQELRNKVKAMLCIFFDHE